MAAHLTAEQRQLALRLKVRGLSLREIGPRWAARTRGESFTLIAAPLGEGDLHGVAGGGRRWRPSPVPGLAGPPARPAAGQAAQDPEAGPSSAGRPGQWLAGPMVVAGRSSRPGRGSSSPAIP
jgi:hypothetical protein